MQRVDLYTPNEVFRREIEKDKLANMGLSPMIIEAVLKSDAPRRHVEFVYHMVGGTHEFAFVNGRPDYPASSKEPIEEVA